ncbi:hypothetical protein EBZ80_24420 [bacterium]|nr:hypothetical protein [bacterium]
MRKWHVHASFALAFLLLLLCALASLFAGRRRSKSFLPWMLSLLVLTLCSAVACIVWQRKAAAQECEQEHAVLCSPCDDLFWILATHACIFVAVLLLWVREPTTTRGTTVRIVLWCTLLLFLVTQTASWWWRSFRGVTARSLVPQQQTQMTEAVMLHNDVSGQQVQQFDCGVARPKFASMVERIRDIRRALNSMRSASSPILVDISVPKAFSTFLLTRSVNTVLSLVKENPDRPPIDLCLMSAVKVVCTSTDVPQPKPAADENLWPVVMETTIRTVKRYARISGEPHDLREESSVFAPYFFDAIHELLTRTTNHSCLLLLLNPLLLWAFSACACEKSSDENRYSLKIDITGSWHVESITALTDNVLLVALLSMLQTADSQGGNISLTDVWESLLLASSLVLSCSPEPGGDVEAWKKKLVVDSKTWQNVVQERFVAQRMVQQANFKNAWENLSTCFDPWHAQWIDCRSATDFVKDTSRTDETRIDRLVSLRLFVLGKGENLRSALTSGGGRTTA